MERESCSLYQSTPATFEFLRISILCLRFSKKKSVVFLSLLVANFKRIKKETARGGGGYSNIKKGGNARPEF